MRKLIVCAALTIIAADMGSIAYAGEVTGGPQPKTTPVRDRAQSVCALSGKEDGVTLVGFDSNGVPIFIFVDTGPGLVQTPHQENAAGIIHQPGIPGVECRGR